MAAGGRLLSLTGGALAVLLALGACAGDAGPGAGSGAAPGVVPTSPAPPPGVIAVADHAATRAPGPAVVDTAGAPLRPEHAEVVRQVHRALASGDLHRLRGLYAGDDWAGQAALLADAPVRHSVIGALCAPPDNLGEGYLYSSPAFQTAFFLDYDPPRISSGPLRWRGIAEAPH